MAVWGDRGEPVSIGRDYRDHGEWWRGPEVTQLDEVISPEAHGLDRNGNSRETIRPQVAQHVMHDGVRRMQKLRQRGLGRRDDDDPFYALLDLDNSGVRSPADRPSAAQRYDLTGLPDGYTRDRDTGEIRPRKSNAGRKRS